MGAEEQADSLDAEEVAIVVEIEVIEMGRKDKIPALRNVSKKKLLQETAKVDKVLSKFWLKYKRGCLHSHKKHAVSV